MYEYYGWISFVYAPFDVENEQQKLDKVVDRAKDLIKQTLPSHHIAEVKVINGEYIAVFAGFANHGSLLAESIIQIFTYIGEEATGSYGILYILDDEDLNFGNEFRVGRLARGKFEFLDDPFLSPRIPTIEDKC